MICIAGFYLWNEEKLCCSCRVISVVGICLLKGLRGMDLFEGGTTSTTMPTTDASFFDLIGRHATSDI
jgi:hypothetical protein